MQSFVIICRSSWVYRVSADAEAGAWDQALAVLGVKVVSIFTSLDWFNLAKAC